MKIAVAGTGYVGLVTGVALASKGHQVVCVDVDANKIELLKKGISPIYEPGLEELLRDNMNNLEFTIEYLDAYKNADIIFIGVGTPEKKDGSANLSYVYKVADQIISALNKDSVVVIKSTVPIGTNEKVETYMRSKLGNEIKISVVSNPEFLAQGTAVRDTLHAGRIVIGANDKDAGQLLARAYQNFDAPILLTTRESAEMIKYASNDFLALKISYINEIANLCELVGADIDEVTAGMGYDERIGKKFLKSGIGYGGSCFPKDTKALNWFASFNDNELKTIRAAIDVNEKQKFKLIKKSKKYAESLDGLNIAVLGLAFKPGTDDLREAPSLVNIPLMLEDGAKVRVWDPVATERFKSIYPSELIYCGTIEEAIKDADLCFIFTEWEEVQNFEVKKYEELMRVPVVLDGRNCYALEKFADTKVIYDSIGRKCINGNLISKGGVSI